MCVCVCECVFVCVCAFVSVFVCMYLRARVCRAPLIFTYLCDDFSIVKVCLSLLHDPVGCLACKLSAQNAVKRWGATALENIRVYFWPNKCRHINVKLLALLLQINSHFILNDNSESIYSRQQRFLVHARFLSTCSQHCLWVYTVRPESCRDKKKGNNLKCKNKLALSFSKLFIWTCSFISIPKS